MNPLSPFKWRHFQPDIMLLCVRWYLRVRHVTLGSIPSETERTGRRFFGSRASPLAERPRGQQHAPTARGDQSVVACRLARPAREGESWIA